MPLIAIYGEFNRIADLIAAEYDVCFHVSIPNFFSLGSADFEQLILLPCVRESFCNYI